MADEKKWVEVTATPDEVWDRSAPIEGELIRVRHEVGPNNSSLYTLLTEDGEVALWGSTALDPRLGELSLHDQVRIEPLGKVKSPKTGREYWDFKVMYIAGERSGYEKAKEVRDSIGGEDVPMTDADMPPDFL
jgi:hypothetical protein